MNATVTTDVSKVPPVLGGPAATSVASMRQWLLQRFPDNAAVEAAVARIRQKMDEFYPERKDLPETLAWLEIKCKNQGLESYRVILDLLEANAEKTGAWTVFEGAFAKLGEIMVGEKTHAFKVFDMARMLAEIKRELDPEKTLQPKIHPDANAD